MLTSRSVWAVIIVAVVSARGEPSVADGLNGPGKKVAPGVKSPGAAIDSIAEARVNPAMLLTIEEPSARQIWHRGERILA
jgi:hypothetical protein